MELPFFGSISIHVMCFRMAIKLHLLFADTAEQHIARVEQLMEEKGKLTLSVVQCMPFGPPRIGKTCLKDRLAGEKKPKGEPATVHDGKVVYPEDVCPSTGAAEDITRLVETTFQEQKGKTEWVQLDFEKEVISFVKGLEYVTTEGGTSHPIGQNDPKSEQLGDKSDISKQKQPSEFPKPSPCDPLSTVKNAFKKKNDPAKVEKLLEDSLTIHFTDTGGQPEFQEVLPAVVSGPSLFFLVFSLFSGLKSRYKVWYDSDDNAHESRFTVKEVLLQCLASIACIGTQRRDGGKPKPKVFTVKEVLLQCLANIACIGTQRRDGGKPKFVKPKVFFVGTQRDLLKDPQKKIEEIDKELRSAIEDIPELDDLVEGNQKENMLLFTVDNYAEKDDRFQTIRDAVRKVAMRVKEMYRVTLPVPFAILDFYLRQPTVRSFSGDPVITVKEFKEIAKECNISAEESVDALWTLQHLLGTVRHFPNVDELKDIVITRPQLFFNIITKLITSKFNRGFFSRRVHDQLINQGIITGAELDRLWSQEERQHLTNKQVVALLKHLHIIAPLSSKSRQTTSYLVPCVLQSFSEQDPSKHTNKVTPLLVSFKCRFVPVGVFSGLLAYLLQQIHKDKLLWILQESFRDYAKFSVGYAPFGNISLTIRSTAKFIRFSLHQDEEEKEEKEEGGDFDLSGVCTSVKGTIVTGLNKVATILNYTVSTEPSFGFQCPRDEQNPHFIEYKGANVSQCFTCRKYTPVPPDFKNWFSGKTVLHCTLLTCCDCMYCATVYCATVSFSVFSLCTFTRSLLSFSVFSLCTFTR